MVERSPAMRQMSMLGARDIRHVVRILVCCRPVRNNRDRSHARTLAVKVHFSNEGFHCGE